MWIFQDILLINIFRYVKRRLCWEASWWRVRRNIRNGDSLSVTFFITHDEKRGSYQHGLATGTVHIVSKRASERIPLANACLPSFALTLEMTDAFSRRANERIDRSEDLWRTSAMERIPIIGDRITSPAWVLLLIVRKIVFSGVRSRYNRPAFLNLSGAPCTMSFPNSNALSVIFEKTTINDKALLVRTLEWNKLIYLLWRRTTEG